MNTARAMGLFLRTWREEWAQLSRAQLAIAVSARCNRRHRVTPDIVRQWERGQPPQSSEELSALLQVMERRGLLAEEGAHFRQAVYAACAAHLYPDLLDGDDLALRDDVEEVGQRVFQGLIVERLSTDLVSLVAGVKQLERAVSLPAGVASAAQRRKQCTALAHLRGALIAARAGEWNGLNPRPERAAMLQVNADFVKAHFGLRGPNAALSVLRHRIVAAFGQAHAERSRPGALRLLELSEEARHLGEQEQAADAYLMAVHCLGEMQEGAYETLAPQGYEYAAMLASQERSGGGLMDLVWGALGDGVYDEAERVLARTEVLSRRSYYPRCQWLLSTGLLALCRGHFGDARTCFSELGWEDRLALCDAAEELGRPVSLAEQHPIRVRLARSKADGER